MSTTSSTLPDDFTVDVTSEDIATGVKGSCLFCPTNLALTRSFPTKKTDQWWVNYRRASICAKPFTKLPDRSRQFAHDADGIIRRFDNGELIQPFTVRFQRLIA